MLVPFYQTTGYHIPEASHLEVQDRVFVFAVLRKFYIIEVATKKCLSFGTVFLFSPRLAARVPPSG